MAPRPSLRSKIPDLQKSCQSCKAACLGLGSRRRPSRIFQGFRQTIWPKPCRHCDVLVADSSCLVDAAAASARHGLAGTVADWRGFCTDLETLTEDDGARLREILVTDFVAFKAGDDEENDRGLFTGYYESELTGKPDPIRPRMRCLSTACQTISSRPTPATSRARQTAKRLLGRLDQGRFVPYYSRAEIDAGALAGRGLELLWADDPVDAFFLHVQGSGRVRLPDGNSLRVGYAGSNGHPFYAIGRHLLDEDHHLSRRGLHAEHSGLAAQPSRGRQEGDGAQQPLYLLQAHHRAKALSVPRAFP